MIFDSIRNRDKYAGIAPEIKMALDYCAKMYEEGFREIDDPLAENVVMKCHPLMTRVMEEIVWEAHPRATDIHFIVSGREKIGYADVKKLNVTRSDPDNDVMFLEGEGDLLTLEPGYFMIAFPDDAHAPSIAVDGAETCEKIVAKLVL